MGDRHLKKTLRLAAALLSLAACEGRLVDPGGGAIHGRVLDAMTGQPVAGARVVSEPDVGTALSDGDGRFTIRGVPIGAGTSVVRVTASQDGYGPVTQSASLSPRTPVAAVEMVLPRLDLDSGGSSLRVRVTDLGGSPVAGSLVRVFDTGGRLLGQGLTDDQGRAGFAVPRGRYLVRAQGAGALAASQVEAPVDVPPLAAASLTLALGRLEVRVTVLSEAPRTCFPDDGRVAVRVEVRNPESVTLADVVLDNRLEARLGQALTEADVVLQRERFPLAAVTLEGGGAFGVRLGTLRPTADWVEAFTLSVPADPTTVACHRVGARAAGPGGALLGEHNACVIASLSLPPAVTVERIGPEPRAGAAFEYRVALENPCPGGSRFAYTTVRVAGRLVQAGAFAALEDVVAGFPTAGRVIEAGPAGFVWEIDALKAGQPAELRLRAAALAAGSVAHRIEVTTREIGDPVHAEDVSAVAP